MGYFFELLVEKALFELFCWYHKFLRLNWAC